MLTRIFGSIYNRFVPNHNCLKEEVKPHLLAFENFPLHKHVYWKTNKNDTATEREQMKCNIKLSV